MIFVSHNALFINKAIHQYAVQQYAVHQQCWLRAEHTGLTGTVRSSIPAHAGARGLMSGGMMPDDSGASGGRRVVKGERLCARISLFSGQQKAAHIQLEPCQT